MEPIRILYFSDVLCVWAYIAQIRLEELKATFQEKILIEPHFVSVFGAAQTKLEDRWRDRGGLAAYSAHVQEVAQKFDHIRVHPEIWLGAVPPSSMSCHLCLHAIQQLEAKGELAQGEKTQGKTAKGKTAKGKTVKGKIAPENSSRSSSMFEAAIWAFREAFFTQRANIADRKVQFEIAEALGVSIAALEAQIETGEAYAPLSQDMDLVKEHTVTISPTLIFNEGRQRLNGNVGYRVMEANIRELLHSPPGEQSWC